MLISLKKMLVCIVLLATFGVRGMGVDLDAIELGKQLVRAASEKDWPTVEKLLAAGADVNQKNSAGWTALMHVAFLASPEINCPEVAHLLLAAGADVNQQNDHGWTALMIAALDNHLEVARLLLAAGADVNPKENAGTTALMIAARWNSPEICRDIVRAYLVPVDQQKECIYTLLNCFRRLYRDQYPNLKNVFKPWLHAMIREASQPMYEDIDQIKNTAIKEELLAICDAQRNQNNQNNEGYSCVIL